MPALSTLTKQDLDFEHADSSWRSRQGDVESLFPFQPRRRSVPERAMKTEADIDT